MQGRALHEPTSLALPKPGSTRSPTQAQPEPDPAGAPDPRSGPGPDPVRGVPSPKPRVLSKKVLCTQSAQKKLFCYTAIFATSHTNRRVYKGSY